jgi:hypothetical protein
MIEEKNSGDLYFSNKYGGDATKEYIGYMAIATHNLLRVNWKTPVKD